MENKKKKIISVFWFIVATELVGYLSSLLSGDVGKKYLQLTKPPLSPPGQLFGIVWPILYALMAIAAALIYHRKDDLSQQALRVYWTQLAFNFLWSILFFGLNLPWVAFAVLIILDILVIYMLSLFYHLNKLSFALIWPYLIWILFATYLNFGIALLN